MKDAPLVARLLPWRSHDRDCKSPDYPDLPSLNPLSALSLDTDSALDLPPPPPFTFRDPSTHKPGSPTLVAHPDAMNSASQLSLATTSAKFVNGVVRPATPADASTSPSTAVSPVSPSAGTSTTKGLSYFPVTSSALVELPGSIMMDNRGFPMAKGDGILKGETKLPIRELTREKFSPSVMKETLATPSRRDGVDKANPASQTTSPIVPELEGAPIAPLPASLRKGQLLPALSVDACTDRLPEKVLARKGRVANDSHSEASDTMRCALMIGC